MNEETITLNGARYILTMSRKSNGLYCSWSARQHGWVKGMPVWESGTHLMSDSDEAKRKVIEKLTSTIAPVQVGLFA